MYRMYGMSRSHGCERVTMYGMSRSHEVERSRMAEPRMYGFRDDMDVKQLFSSFCNYEPVQLMPLPNLFAPEIRF